jgi:hypothetical protein
LGLAGVAVGWALFEALAGGRRSASGLCLALLFALPASLMAEGALWRLALSAGAVGPGGLQWGRVEWRLAAVRALGGLFLSILGLLFFIVILGFAYAAASAGPGFSASDVRTWPGAVNSGGRWMVSLVTLGLAALLAWASARIALASAATVSSERVQVLASWPLSRGRVAAILLAKTLAFAAPAALWMALDLALAQGQGRFRDLALPLSLALGLTICGLATPLLVGFFAALFRNGRAPLARVKP